MDTLLTQTLEMLASHGKAPNDVRWVGHVEPDFLKGIGKPRDELPFGTWGEFERYANFEYDDGYGAVEININLVIVGDDWWLERHTYDGAESWQFKTLPKPPRVRLQLRADDLRED